MSKPTPSQNALLRALIKAGPAGIPLGPLHEKTVDGLLRRGLIALQNGRVVLIAPTATRRTGVADKTVVVTDGGAS